MPSITTERHTTT